MAGRDAPVREVTMVQDEQDGIRFGRTVICAVLGDPFQEPVDAIILATNTRGLLTASAPGTLRHLAGTDVERQLRNQAPLPLGGAVLTSADLNGNGTVRHFVHALVFNEPGGTARIANITTAADAAFNLLEGTKARTVALPLIGDSDDSTPEWRARLIAALLDSMVGHLRRGRSRLVRITFVVRYEDDQVAITRSLLQMRQRAWLPAS